MSAIRYGSRGGSSLRRIGNRERQENDIPNGSGGSPIVDEANSMPTMDPAKKLIEPDHGHNFKPNPTEVVHKIVMCMKSKYDEAWISWKKVPKDVRDMWFGEFQKEYQWHPQHSQQIRKNFESRGGIRLKNLFRNARKKNKCPIWITESVWKLLQDQWKTKEFKGKSEQAKKNRSSDVNGLGTSLHTGGSIPMTEHKRRLEIREGKEISDIDLFLATHQKKDKTWVDNRSAKTFENWTNAWKEMETNQEDEECGTQSLKLTQDQLWARDNKTKKGTIYGLGAEGGKYKNLTHGHLASSSYMDDQSDKKKMAAEIEELKLENLNQKEETKKVAEQNKKLSEEMEAMKKMFHELKEGMKKKKKRKVSHSIDKDVLDMS